MIRTKSIIVFLLVVTLSGCTFFTEQKEEPKPEKPSYVSTEMEFASDITEPQEKIKGPIHEPIKIVITINDKNEFRVNERVCPNEKLEQKLNFLLHRRIVDDCSLLIKVNKHSFPSTLIHVMEVARNVGFLENITITRYE